MTDRYQTYRGLPPLAGICTMQEAARPGLGVDECVARLKRYHYVLRRLYEIFTSRIASEPVYELKMAFSFHAHLCAEHASALRKRVGEMREPPLGLDKVPDESLKLFLDEVQAAPTTFDFVLATYGLAVPALIAALNRHLDDTHPLADHPSVRVCRFALLELNDMAAYGESALDALDDDEASEKAAPWIVMLQDCLAAAGGLDGASEPAAVAPAARYSAKPYVYDPVPKRDERFVDPYNGGVNPELFLYDPSYPNDAKVLMMFYKRLREIDVPEMMSSILSEVKDKPWDFHRDMVRQLWDEARHAMMGEVGFASLGIDWHTIPVNFTWSLNLNTQLTAVERHAVLYFIEQGLMDKTGKRYEWEVGVASGNELARVFQDYDWADEVLHAAIGREWYVRQFDSKQEAIDYGDRCWSRVMGHWREYRDRGLTQHRNWWPVLYLEACTLKGRDPDPAALAYCGTYEDVRADLKGISASA